MQSSYTFYQMSFTATACCLYPISMQEGIPISRFTAQNCNDTHTYLTVTIRNEGDDVTF